VLVAIAREPYTNYSEIKGIGMWGRPEATKRIRKIVIEALNKPPVERPRRQNTRTNVMSNKEREKANTRLKELKEWRKTLAEGIGIDPSLLWPTISLDRLSKDPSRFKEEISEPRLRKWQYLEFGKELEDKLACLQ